MKHDPSTRPFTEKLAEDFNLSSADQERVRHLELVLQNMAEDFNLSSDLQVRRAFESLLRQLAAELTGSSEGPGLEVRLACETVLRQLQLVIAAPASPIPQ